MKKIILALIFCGTFIFAKSQNQMISVESSTYGIQVGVLGIWVYNETKLSEKIVLRSELGLDAGIFGNSNSETIYMTPVITLEPRWYYNFKKRVSKSRNISGNSGNFISLQLSYHPDWFVISNDNLKVTDQISIIPTWGVRRSIGDHFNYEAGIGLGFRHYFAKSLKVETELAGNLHLRIGYRF